MNEILTAIKETIITMFTDWLKLYNSVDFGPLKIMATITGVLGAIIWIKEKLFK